MTTLVVTPTLGDSRWLPACVDSVARYRGNGVHVLVAPSGKADALRQRFTAVRVVAEPEPCRGMYAAINAGVRAATEWDAFTYLNDDDLLLPGFARVVQETAPRCAAACIAYGGVRLVDAEGRRLGAIPVSPSPVLNRDLYAQRLEPVFQHGTLITRSAWERLRGFDETFKYCGDTEFLARACLLGVPFRRVGGGTVAAFRLRPGQLTKNRPAMLAERERVDAQLGLVATKLTARHLWAKLRFRTANLPVYVERVARHGFVTFDELLERGA